FNVVYPKTWHGLLVAPCEREHVQGAVRDAERVFANLIHIVGLSISLDADERTGAPDTGGGFASRCGLQPDLVHSVVYSDVDGTEGTRNCPRDSEPRTDHKLPEVVIPA